MYRKLLLPKTLLSVKSTSACGFLPDRLGISEIGELNGVSFLLFYPPLQSFDITIRGVEELEQNQDANGKENLENGVSSANGPFIDELFQRCSEECSCLIRGVSL